jgi:chromosome segregation ATPase
LIVFVNRTQNFSATNKALAAQVSAAQNHATAAAADAQAAREAGDKVAAQASAQVTQMQTQVTDLRSKISDRDTLLAQAASTEALGAAERSKLAESLKASEDQKTKQADALAQARADLDKYLKNNADLNLAVTDLTNKVEVSDTERKNFQEQLNQAQTELETARKQLTDAGIKAGTPAGVAAGAPPINGVVRQVQPINGIPYATISVGSDESVQKGMQFQIIDRERGLFLGQLIVDSVEPHQATGRLAGPHVGDVHPGVEVRTQL